MAYNHYYIDTKKTQPGLYPQLLYTGIVVDDPDWFNIEHSHDFCEILYVAHGSGTAILSHKAYRITAGDLVIINPGVLHEEKSEKSDPLNLIFLAAENFQIGVFKKNCMIGDDACPVVHTEQHRLKIESYFWDLLRETSSKVEYYLEMAQSLLVALLLFISRMIMANDAHQLSEECLKVKKYINENYTKPITLETLSQNVYISKHHLSHLFKNQTGTSPIKYLITRRIEEAKLLLGDSDHTIKEIAEMVGYDDPAHFSQIFKKTAGISPLSYRNSAMK